MTPDLTLHVAEALRDLLAVLDRQHRCRDCAAHDGLEDFVADLRVRLTVLERRSAALR